MNAGSSTKKTQKSGFSLIEMLIVISIISVLALVAVSSYEAARRQTRLSALGDTLVATLKRQQALAKHGKVNVVGPNSTDLSCYGFYLEKGKQLQLVKAPFITVNTSIRSDKSNFCHMLPHVVSNFSNGESFIVSSLYKFGTQTDTLAVMFVPPFGNAIVGQTLSTDALTAPAGGVQDPSVCLAVGLENIQEQVFIKFDVASGLISRSKLPC